MQVLVTGAAGRIGLTVCKGLADLGYSLTMLDRRSDPRLDLLGDFVLADISSAQAMQAIAGHDAVVHLAGTVKTEPFDLVVQENIVGTYQVFEAACSGGVPRVVYASSNHAVGMIPRAPMVGTDVPMRPDSLYGVSKVFGEALGRLYADRYRMQVACLRIGTFRDKPTEFRHLSTWLSPDDAVRLVRACLITPELDYSVVYGVSRNTRGWWDLEPGRRLGYEPRDDAEDYAPEVLAATSPVELAADHLANVTLGGR